MTTPGPLRVPDKDKAESYWHIQYGLEGLGLTPIKRINCAQIIKIIM
jgi:hypothetical protein